MAKGKTSKGKWALGIGVAVVIVVILFMPNGLFEDGVPAPGEIITRDDPVDDSSKVNEWEGPVDINFVVSDKLDPNINYGEDTELDIIIYRYDEGTDSYKKLKTPSQAEIGVAQVNSSPSLKTVYAEINVAAAQAYYVDPTSLTNNDKSAGANRWLDLNNNGRPAFVAPIDITGWSAQQLQTPSFDYFIELIDQGTFTLDNPPDLDVTDTGKQRCSIKWSLDATASGDGIAVKELELSFDTNDKDNVYPLDSNIKFPTGTSPLSAKESITLQEMEDLEQASSYRFNYEFGDGDLNDARLLLSPLNGEQEFEIPAEIWVNNDVVTNLNSTLTVYFLDSHGTTTSTTDTVMCG